MGIPKSNTKCRNSYSLASLGALSLIASPWSLLTYLLLTYLKTSLPRHKPSLDFINFGLSLSGGKVRPAPSIDALIIFVFMVSLLINRWLRPMWRHLFCHFLQTVTLLLNNRWRLPQYVDIICKHSQIFMTQELEIRHSHSKNLMIRPGHALIKACSYF